MTRILAIVDEALARRRLSGGWRRLFRRRASRGLELVYLPCYCAVLASGTERTIHVLVDGHEGHVSFADLARTACESCEATDEHFMPTLSAAAAIERIDRELLTLRLGRWGKAARVPPCRECELAIVHYPYWVYYFRRRRDTLDFSMLDALTGRPAGPKAKLAFLAALAAKKNRERVSIHNV